MSKFSSSPSEESGELNYFDDLQAKIVEALTRHPDRKLVASEILEEGHMHAYYAATYKQFGYLVPYIGKKDFNQVVMLAVSFAISRYSLSYDSKFYSYAFWYIRGELISALQNNHPVFRADTRLDRAVFPYAKLLRKNPSISDKDLAEKLEITSDQLNELKFAYFVYTNPLVQLSAFTDEGTLVEELFEGEDGRETVDQAIMIAELSMAVRNVVAHLKLGAREQTVLSKRLYVSDKTSTLDDIAEEFGVSRERIRQVESKLKAKLRRRLLRVSADLME